MQGEPLIYPEFLKMFFLDKGYKEHYTDKTGRVLSQDEADQMGLYKTPDSDLQKLGITRQLVPPNKPMHNELGPLIRGVK